MRIDYLGAVLLSIGVTSLLLGLQGDFAFALDGRARGLALYAITVVALAGFVVQECATRTR